MQDALKNGKLRRELQGRRSADNQQRALAEREIEYDDRGRKIPRPMFLRPEDIAQGVDYDVEKVLCLDASLCSTCTKQKFKIGGINRLFSLIQLIRPLPHNLTVVILVFYHNPIFL